MTDNRPTPRYGELAPEGWVWSPPVDPRKTEAESAGTAPDEAAADNVASAASSTAPYRVLDASISVFLLVTAVMISSSSVPSLFDLRSTLEMFYADRGLGDYGGGSAVDIAGAIAAIAQLVLLAATIWLTVRLIGQRRRSWPVPLLMGALALIVTFGCVALALVADPGLLSSLSAS
ncbi:DUF6264 family protein [Agreia bicolorata]|uniref:Uncharacterized protein n=1 Tax=Agreia bicolorata TaxID=110935 RepID=A0ABR5CJ36_9MICO|nr:DUF6264 family protein [Agreia bicolorata]KJC65675.1 hypothetical protein TZ00_02440 [Agreia bicolorata]